MFYIADIYMYMHVYVPGSGLSVCVSTTIVLRRVIVALRV